jgi:hypothetical protein
MNIEQNVKMYALRDQNDRWYVSTTRSLAQARGVITAASLYSSLSTVRTILTKLNKLEMPDTRYRIFEFTLAGPQEIII